MFYDPNPPPPEQVLTTYVLSWAALFPTVSLTKCYLMLASDGFVFIFIRNHYRMSGPMMIMGFNTSGLNVTLGAHDSSRFTIAWHLSGFVSDIMKE